MRHAFTRTDLAAVLSTAAVLGALGVTLATADPSGRTERLTESLANLRAIGAANAAYRADNAGYLALEMTTTRRRPRSDGSDASGWCTWSWGGKNCNAYWYTASNGPFDVEAADRPLNPYLYPSYVFSAPPPPARLRVNDPARSTQQARVFRDPSDVNGHSRTWPNANSPAISSYDDVGTSYMSQMAWMDQLFLAYPALSVGARFRNGTARLANDQGVDPARFLQVYDETGDLVLNSANSHLQHEGNQGITNTGVALFTDGHAGLVTFRPGYSRTAKINDEYSVWFEDLGRPAAPGLPDAAIAETK